VPVTVFRDANSSYKESQRLRYLNFDTMTVKDSIITSSSASSSSSTSSVSSSVSSSLSSSSISNSQSASTSSATLSASIGSAASTSAFNSSLTSSMASTTSSLVSSSQSSSSISSSVSSTQNENVSSAATSSKSKIGITDPYFCGGNIFGEVSGLQGQIADVTVKLYKDIYKDITKNSEYTFYTKTDKEGKWFIPGNTLPNGKFTNVYSTTFENNKAEGSYDLVINQGTQCNAANITPTVISLARTGGVTMLALPFLFIFCISIKQLLESLTSHLTK
jgi:hypothetical protein